MTDATLPGHDERCESEAVGGTSSLGSQVTVLQQPDGAEGRGGGTPEGNTHHHLLPPSLQPTRVFQKHARYRAAKSGNQSAISGCALSAYSGSHADRDAGLMNRPGQAGCK